MTTALSTNDIEAAIAAAENLRAELQSLFEKLDSTIRDLTGSDFIGDGAEGYMEFFTAKIQPALRDNLFEDDSSLISALKTILQNIQDQLIASVDPALGQNNRSV